MEASGLEPLSSFRIKASPDDEPMLYRKLGPRKKRKPGLEPRPLIWSDKRSCELSYSRMMTCLHESFLDWPDKIKVLRFVVAISCQSQTSWTGQKEVCGPPRIRDTPNIK